MAGVGDDDQLCLWPRLVEVPGREHRANDVVPPLDDDSRNPAEAAHVVEELAILPEEPAVHEVVTLDAREGLGETTALELLDELRIDPQLARRRFPDRPGPRGLKARPATAARQPLVVRLHEVAALAWRDRLQVPLPGIGEEVAGPLLVEPLQLFPSKQEDAAEDETLDPLGVCLAVREGERAAPASTEDDPPVDAGVLTKPLDVCDEVPGRVLPQLGVGRAPPASPLIEQDHAPLPRMEVAPVQRVEPCPGA